MGIFSRLFKGGQDGNPTDPEGEGDEADQNGDAGEPTIEVQTDDRDEPAVPSLAPSFAVASSPVVASTEPISSIWAWPASPMPTPPQPRPAPAAPTRATTASERTPEPSKDRDPTMVMSPPPAPSPSKTTIRTPASAPAPAPPAAATPPAPAAPTVPSPAKPATPRVASQRPAKRAHSDSISSAFDSMIDDNAPSTTRAKHGASTAADLSEVRGVFNEVAAIHVAQVRDVMLELRYGHAESSWIESTRPALRSLRAMAAQMELTDLCTALDEFCAGVEAVVHGRTVTDDTKTELLRRYQRLIELIPQAFELDAERDRREPIIVEALLCQIEGVEKPIIDKLFAVGLGRLDALLRANTDDLAVVSGIRREVANAIVERFKAYRASATASMSAPDPAAERKLLADLLLALSVQNDDFNKASGEWTDDARARKREVRKQREQTFQQIKVALARLGERDQLARLEKLPFDERIAAIDRYLSTPQARS
jgi:hypothetical protein